VNDLDLGDLGGWKPYSPKGFLESINETAEQQDPPKTISHDAEQAPSDEMDITIDDEIEGGWLPYSVKRFKERLTIARAYTCDDSMAATSISENTTNTLNEDDFHSERKSFSGRARFPIQSVDETFIVDALDS
jgi:hypothetical protein